MAYPDAAWRPNPLEPPVTTATLPLREKMFLKSLSVTSASADMMARFLVERRGSEVVYLRRRGKK